MSLITYNGESKVIKRICELLDTMSSVNFEVVQTLPLVDISTSTIYLVPKQTAQTDNIYDEYINTDGTSQGWELIGTTEIDLTNYVQFSDLSAVATSGDYDDLIDKPTIPTVNDGTLTIQLNGENQQTFTANSSTNKTANIKAVDWVSNGKLGAKNLIPLTVDEIKRNSGGTWVGNVRQINGVSFEILTDSYGYVTGIKANGTASARTNLWIYNYTNKLFMGLKSDRYILSKSGKTGTNFGFCYYQNSTWVTQTNAITSDAEVTLDTDSATYNCIGIVLTVEKNTVCSNDIFKPMLRYASDTDDTWQPYSMTNQELTNVVNGVPTTAGVYSLQATRDANGNVTYSWV